MLLYIANNAMIYTVLYARYADLEIHYEEKFHDLGTPINRCVGTKLHLEQEQKISACFI